VSPDLLVALVEEGIWTRSAAVANARHIADRKERARALVKLVARLGRSSEVQTGVLAATREIQEPEWRAAALTGIAPHLPEAERHAVISEALSTAREIDFEQRFDWIDHYPLPPAAYVRGATIAELVPLLTEDDRPAVAAEAMRAVLAADNRNWGEWKAALLRGLTEHLNPDEKLTATAEAERALEEATSPILPPPGHAVPYRHPEAMLPDPADARVAVRALESAHSRSKAFFQLAARLPETERRDVVIEGLDAARAIDYADWRAEALCRLSSLLPRGERRDIVAEALACTRSIDDDWNREKALERLAAYENRGPPARSPSAAGATKTAGRMDSRTAFASALARAQDVDDAYQRQGRLQHVVLELVEVPPAVAYPFWCQALRLSATRVRTAFLSDLEALTPLIFALGGVAAIAETASAITDVGHWFP
jgi:hypothetical protein